MNKVLSIVVTSMLAMGAASAYADETCTDSAVKAIEAAGENLHSNQYEPTATTAKSIIAIADSCESSAVRVAAAKKLAKALSSGTEPTSTVAVEMKRLCGSDAGCAVEAIESLKNGIHSNQTEPTITAAHAIVEIVKRAPTQTVKQKAIEALSMGLGSGTSPGSEISEAIAEVGKCE
ncbi:MAG: hypothetical protein WCW52_10800 [Elusimicrobiales bacterium]|jgi:hypothetical protein